MPDKIRAAIDALQGLAAEQQRAAARAILHSAAAEREEWPLTDEQIGDLQRRMVNPNRRSFSIAETRERSRRFDA